MAYLRTFGGLAIDGVDAPTGAAAQRSRLALLAFLAEASPVSRDRVLARFWPEHDDSGARAALRQALYSLKRDLAVEQLVTGRSDLRLDRTSVGSDVADFVDASAGGDARRLVQFYRGPFLDGVHLRDNAEFDSWAESSRRRFASMYSAALEQLAGESAASGDALGAAGWWRARTDEDPLNGRVAIAYVDSLVEAGDPDAALQYTRDFVERFRTEVGADPDQEILALPERIRARATIARTFAAREKSPAATSAADGAEPDAPSQPLPLRSDAGVGNRRRPVAAVLMALAAAALLGIAIHVMPILGTGRGDAPLRKYRAGRDAYQHGRYEEATQLYLAALEEDSTYLPAALDLVWAAAWATDAPARELATRLAWHERDRLSAADRAHLDAIAGPRYPGLANGAELAAAWERATQLAPDRADVWFGLGDMYLHEGGLLGHADALARAELLFRRSLAADSSFLPSLEHLIQLTARRGDTAALRSLASRYERLAPLDSNSAWLYWRIGLALSDTQLANRARVRFDSAALSSLRWVVIETEYDDLDSSDAERALEIWKRRAMTDYERLQVDIAGFSLALARGADAQAIRALAELRRVPKTTSEADELAVVGAMYGGLALPSVSVDSSARRLRDGAHGSSLSGFAREDLCLAGQWAVRRDAIANAVAIERALANAAIRQSDTTSDQLAGFCSRLIAASVAERRGELRVEMVDSLSAMLRQGPPIRLATFYAPLALSRLYASIGDVRDAAEQLRDEALYGRWPYSVREIRRAAEQFNSPPPRR